MRCLIFTPENYLFPSTISTPFNTPILDRPQSPSQTAFSSNEPFCHNTRPGRLTDQQTDRQTERWIEDKSVYTNTRLRSTDCIATRLIILRPCTFSFPCLLNV